MSSPKDVAITEATSLLPPQAADSTYSSVSSTEEPLSQKHTHGKSKFQNNQFPEDTFEHAVRDAYESVISDTEHDEDDEDTRWLRQERLNHKLMKWYKRPSLLLISAVVFVFASGVGVSASARIQLYLELACKKVMLEPSAQAGSCTKSKLQVMVSQLQSLISVAGAIVTILLAGKIGAYSDIYGRKMVILYILLLAFLSKVAILYMVSPIMNTLHVWLIVAAHLLESLGGGVFVFLAVCNSYITDIVEDHMRIYSIGIVIASLFLGMSIGPVLGSLIVKFTGSNLNAMYADVGLTFSALLLALLILPESRSKLARRKSRRFSIAADEQRRSVITSKGMYYYSNMVEAVNIWKPLKLLWLPAKRPDGTKNFKPRITVLLILLIDICLMSTTAALGSIIPLYGTYMFDWDAVEMGYYMAISSTTKTLVLVLFSPFFLYQLKKRIKIETRRVDRLDIVCIRFAVTFQTLSVLVLTFANHSYLYIAHSFFQCFESMATPTLHSAVIKYASVESTGAVFGALATVRNLVNLVAPAGLLYIYSVTVEREPRATYYVALGIVALLIIFSLLLGSDHLLRDNELDNIITSASDDNAIANLRLQKDQRERLHRFMVMRRESSSSVASSVNSAQGSPVKQTPLNHSRNSSATFKIKR